MAQYDKKYWDDRFEFAENVPQKVKNAIMRVYESYPESCMPQGLCDPMYIMNVICFELGVGDGKRNFSEVITGITPTDNPGR